MFSWLSTADANRFGKDLGEFLLGELADSLGKTEPKFASKIEKALLRADQKVAEFKTRHKPNVFQRAKLANAFLWTLKDGGCPPEYAEKLTDWLSIRI